MAYRNGTYVAFHGENTSDPTASDFRYYSLLTAWHVREDNQFNFIDSHEKTSAVRGTSKKATLERVLKTRLRNSRNMILIVGKTTKEDTDWVPFEIEYAADTCEIPIIAAYPGNLKFIFDPSRFSHLWPEALKTRIRKNTASVIHIPFREEPLKEAVSQFTHNNLPAGALSYYTEAVYRDWGLYP